MWKLIISTSLLFVLASCTASLAIAAEEDGLQTCEFVANTIVDGEIYEEVIFLENVLTLRDYGDFYVLESINQRELTAAGGSLSRQLINKRTEFNGEIITYVVLSCIGQ